MERTRPECLDRWSGANLGPSTTFGGSKSKTTRGNQLIGPFVTLWKARLSKIAGYWVHTQSRRSLKASRKKI